MNQRTRSKHAARIALACMLVAAACALCACAPQQSGSASASSAPAESPSAASSASAAVVPNVVSLTSSDAEKSIVAAGLKLGAVSHEESDTVPAGNVISQDPAALANAATGDAVAIVISTGKPAPKDVKVPDVKGLHQKDAEDKLAAAGLTGICGGREETTESDPGLVFEQSVEPGTTVKEGAKVTFTIAMAPKTVEVPDVVGASADDAATALTDAGLSFDSTSAYSDSVEEGLVISQSYSAGSEVQAGTTISVVVSLGAMPVEEVTVPNVLTASWSDAEESLESAGLVARYTGDPSGVVVDQDIDAGTQVDQGTTVTVTLSSPGNEVEVPDLVGLSATSAEEITDNAGLGLDTDTGGAHGTVDSQQPKAGTLVAPGTTVYVTLDTSDFE